MDLTICILPGYTYKHSKHKMFHFDMVSGETEGDKESLVYGTKKKKTMKASLPNDLYAA